jgi:hypothetical protein
MPHHRALRTLTAVALAALPASALAQPSHPVSPWWAEYAVGDELERYLRSLQALGDVAVHPWSVRGFGPQELERLHPTSAVHPWAGAVAPPDSARRAYVRLVRPEVRGWYNSAFAHGSNDGVVWAGRGFTGSISAGVAARYGPLSVAVRPIAFRSENREFALAWNGLEGIGRFGDAGFPSSVDRPQRFGTEAYARVDAGESTVRLDLGHLAIGASTAAQWWGPAQEFPFLLGNNAGGFPHAFVGTARPADLWIARVHGRIVYGRLEQSEYFVPQRETVRARRFATGLTLVATPRGVPNLELGVARFFHVPWPDSGFSGRYFTRPFEGILKGGLDEIGADADARALASANQLASVFARLVLPGTGFEAYTEIGREDHAWDLRHLILSPDENASFTFGFRQTARRAAGRGLAVVRGEVIAYGHGQADRVKGGGAIYLHASGADQGHTLRGQLLGADVGVGSGGAHVLGVDLYDRRGRTTAEWRRVVRRERLAFDAGGAPNTEARDVVHTLTAERLLLGRRGELSAALDLSYNLNRHFAEDRTNVGVRLSLRGLPW